MKKIILLATVAVATLSSCTDTKKVAEYQEQIRRLESQILKERQENAELSSFRFSLESQFKKKSEDYAKCQEDSKETFETLTIKYNRLLDDYNKAQTSYRTLNETYEANRENTAKLIADLEERVKSSRAVKARKRRR